MAMKVKFKPREIDDHVLKLTVGLIALGLPCLTSFLSANQIGSISASYYERGWASDFFIGCLFAISSFMFAYNGDSLAEMILSKIVALAGLGVALFPCRCGKDRMPRLFRTFTTFSRRSCLVSSRVFASSFTGGPAPKVTVRQNGDRTSMPYAP